jgi:phage RecT family recombinase
MTENAITPRNNFDRIRAMARSDEVLSRFAEVLGPSAPTFISSVLIAVQNNDKLMECTPASIIAAAMRAATLRLSCDPALGQAYPVPYFDNRAGCYKAQFQIGYKGMVQLALRTGKYRHLNVAPVFEGQTVIEDQMRGIHAIAGTRTSKTVTGYMLFFQLISGFEKTYYMSVEDILEHAQRYSKTFNQEKGFWKTQTGDMMKKTVLLAGLRRWGYFDPNDAMNMTSTAQTTAEEEEEFEGIDLEFSEPKPAADAYRELTGEEMPADQKQKVEPTADPADPYADLKELAKTKIADAFWNLQKRIGYSKEDAQAIITGCKGDMPKAFAALLRNAPPA